MSVKVIPISDAYREGWGRIAWDGNAGHEPCGSLPEGEATPTISDPFWDDPIRPYGAKPLGGFVLPVALVEVRR